MSIAVGILTNSATPATRQSMQFFLFIWRNLARPLRSGLTIVGLAVAVAAVVALVGISFSILVPALCTTSGESTWWCKKVGSGAELNNDLPEAMGDDIQRLSHVTNPHGRIGGRDII